MGLKKRVVPSDYMLFFSLSQVDNGPFSLKKNSWTFENVKMVTCKSNLYIWFKFFLRWWKDIVWEENIFKERVIWVKNALKAWININHFFEFDYMFIFENLDTKEKHWREIRSSKVTIKIENRGCDLTLINLISQFDPVNGIKVKG